MLSITSQFDAGAISVIDATQPNKVVLALRGDNASQFSQWFYFALHAEKGQNVQLSITELAKSAYPKGWINYQPVISFDRVAWTRVPASFDGDTLNFNIAMEGNTVYCAYFEPYSSDRYLDFIADLEANPAVSVRLLGTTLQGRAMHLLQIADETALASLTNRQKIWLIARQHPGETMASWFMEGFINQLLNPNHAVARTLRERYIFYIVPHMNPDGAAFGNLRTNFAGANLNREWETPTIEASPEVYHTRQAMESIGVDLFLDIHGDESLPYVFLSGSEGTPSYSPKRAQLESYFTQSWMQVCPDLQTQFGYEKDEPGKANMTLATPWVAERFDCLAYTVEMPFKDNANGPDQYFGWSADRSAALGATCIYAIDQVMDFSKTFS